MASSSLKIDTKESGTRFKMEGPARDDKQQAAQDLSSIRAAADKEAYAVRWLEGDAAGRQTTSRRQQKQCPGVGALRKSMVVSSL